MRWARAAFSPKGASAESSYSEIVMEAESGRVLYENDSDKVMPMASTTKVLTALIIVEDCDLSDVFEIPAEACGIEGSSIYLVCGGKTENIRPFGTADAPFRHELQRKRSRSITARASRRLPK